LYNADDPELQAWLQAGGNYGVAFSEGIAGADLDNPELRRIFENKINTFEVKSGRADGSSLHAYFRTNATENGAIFDENGKNIGNIQVHHKYVVGPGCNHFSGGVYKIVNDVPLQYVSKELLDAIFGDQLKWAGARIKEAELEAKEERKHIDRDIPIQQVIPDFDKLKRTGGHRFHGSHPTHSSTTGQNFCVNTAKNCWHCFRCNSGGGPLLWLAVQEGVIQCHEAQKGVLKGEVLAKAIELAQELNFNINPPQQEPNVKKFF
jgi:hypothetical protein